MAELCPISPNASQLLPNYYPIITKNVVIFCEEKFVKSTTLFRVASYTIIQNLKQNGWKIYLLCHNFYSNLANLLLNLTWSRDLFWRFRKLYLVVQHLFFIRFVSNFRWWCSLPFSTRWLTWKTFLHRKLPHFWW